MNPEDIAGRIDAISREFVSPDPRSIELDGDIHPADDIVGYETDIPSFVSETPRPSNAFLTAQKIIEDGIAKSTKGGYAVLRVEVPVKGSTDLTISDVVRMPLVEFLSARCLRDIVSDEKERNELYEQYKGTIEAYSAGQRRMLANAALRSPPPPRREQGYDTASLASNDDTFSDN